MEKGTDQCCAHKTVVYRPLGGRGTGLTPRWFCEGCGTEFCLASERDDRLEEADVMYKRYKAAIKERDEIAEILRHQTGLTRERADERNRWKAAVAVPARLFLEGPASILRIDFQGALDAMARGDLEALEKAVKERP